jgi:hypothetical protein
MSYGGKIFLKMSNMPGLKGICTQRPKGEDEYGIH